jgi:hypothetical protein
MGKKQNCELLGSAYLFSFQLAQITSPLLPNFGCFLRGSEFSRLTPTYQGLGVALFWCLPLSFPSFPGRGELDYWIRVSI